MRNLCAFVLYGIAAIIGIIMWVMWVRALMGWLGDLYGILAGVFIAPGLLVYPLVHWIAENSWPTTYSTLYAVAFICGGCAFLLWSRDD